MKKLFSMLQVTLLMGFALLQSANAADAIYTSYFSNKAAGGYDVVAYFTENKPVEGDSKYTLEYQGADWYFSSADNLALFKGDPEKYAPQYGGYCAWAMASDNTAPGKPAFWSVYKGKLYLNYDESVQATWVNDKDKFIEQADLNWNKLNKE
ncbi:YHS domain protein [Psychromonas sp. B3M02]|uniref:YHS domain-containing (seleno)protein n=1 Tax=Psychromonas sp. B3M02 TaxID=2267226 RepID=UPI000DE9C5B9|nr:YHS domain-containing (seleno)protein [Psychromonas sp. B3M02]RBW46500.1 YHS domain protein [Psychromonas sp. B3M02]